MKIQLNTNTGFWGLPDRKLTLNAETPSAEVDLNTLTKFEKQVIDNGLASGLIVLEGQELAEPVSPKKNGRSFLPAIRIDSSVAEFIFEEEEGQKEKVSDVIDGFETWAKENEKSLDNRSFREYLEKK